MAEKICPECNGEGVVDQGTEDERRCPTCNGSGIVPDDGQRSEEVWNTHPAGDDGELANRRSDQEASMKPNKASPAAAAAMREFLDGIHSHAHFRYPINGQWDELDKAFQAKLDEMFGPEIPNSAHNRWVRKLRHFGLIR
jgi:hypothetical protein